MPDRCHAPVRSVTFLGDYLPRQCGIATFTHDILEAVAARYPDVRCGVIAVNDPGQTYDYTSSVRFEIEEQEPDSYRRAADFLNLSGSDVVCIQHEFGIYGGPAGSYLLKAARRSNAPIVTTLHTILERPNPTQDKVLRELAGLSARVIVMSARAKALLSSVYEVPEELIDLIPHGIPDMPFVDSSFYKDKIGVDGKFVLLTFGLLSANKGIEHVIEAMPQILEEFPNVVYIVLGATHPHVVRTDGEAYRRGLERRAKELGVEHAVVFHDRFVDIEELKEFIAVADMYVTPYLNPAQITSGTLAYAFGCGKAVISTPYLHASELLADDRGILVPFGNADAIARATLDLLRDDSRRHAMRKRAYLLGREMIWSEVAARYMESFEKARQGRWKDHGARPARPSIAAPNLLSEIHPASVNLNHLRRMTDSTGIMQHARFALPHRPEGYCTDDNARALALTVTLASKRPPTHGIHLSGLIGTYASFLNAAFNEDTGKFRNFMSYDRRWVDDGGSDDCQGRALFALGTCIASSSDENLRRWAAGMFLRAMPAILDTTSPRAWAHALLGIDAYLRPLSGDTAARGVAGELQKRLVACFHATQSSDWPWFEEALTYENAVLSQALIVRGRDDTAVLSLGLRTLKWLLWVQTSRTDHFRPIGCDGFFPRDGDRAVFDQQPIEAAGMVSACLAAYRVTGDESWVEPAAVAYEWFLGRNDLGVSLFDIETGGCRDGLCVDRMNMNQGAESTLAYLSACVHMEGLYGTNTLSNCAGMALHSTASMGRETDAVTVITVAPSRRRADGDSRPLAL